MKLQLPERDPEGRQVRQTKWSRPCPHGRPGGTTEAIVRGTKKIQNLRQQAGDWLARNDEKSRRGTRAEEDRAEENQMDSQSVPLNETVLGEMLLAP